MPDAPGRPQPSYVETASGPLRVWRGGSGPHLIVLPGLVRSASVVAHEMALAHPGWAVTVVEMPGVGGSWRIDPSSAEQLATVIDEALSLLGVDSAVLVARDLCAPVGLALAALRGERFKPVLARQSLTRGWLRRGVRPPPLALREDGTHLVALWAHFRDLSMLDADDPLRVARHGDPLATPSELDAAVVAAAVAPLRYAALWDVCASACTASAGASQATDADDAETLSRVLALWAPRLPVAIPAETSYAAPAMGDRDAVRHTYLQTAAGRVHLRRVGQGAGRTLLMFHSAPGSAEPLEALMSGLATDREVIACDYLGNGDSDKAQGDIDIAALAQHALGIVDALHLDKVDLFGTHTGAMVAMEFAIGCPHRIGRMVLEAPVLIEPSLAADILEHYLPPLLPDRWGAHLLRAWNMRRDMFLFWPWYLQSRESVRALGIPPLQTLHAWTVGLLKSGATYDRSYRAAFVYPTRMRLPLIPCPALVCAGPADMLVEGLALARSLAPAGTQVVATPATVWYPGQSPEAIAATITLYDRFLRET